MNLEIASEGVLKELREQSKGIAFTVHSGQCRWLLDWQDHFNLNQRLNIEAHFKKPAIVQYLPKDIPIEVQLKTALAEFRGGIDCLDAHNFFDYLKQEDVCAPSTQALADLLFSAPGIDLSALHRSLWHHIIHGGALSDDFWRESSVVLSLLPKFYINFDRKLFMHMRRERFFEKVVPEGWTGVQGDFEHLVPVEWRYWERKSEEDLWAFTNYA
ncbi:hypothetical protein [Hydrogenophaga sp. 5NK40-0174]|uniref:hypothetical protein n=1 Tax=Hydrogenophaga sp. 5NK40-0174 TaxID=3127649 RepID=UPI00310358DF